MRDVTLPHTFVGFAVGLGIGAALGVLFAPKSGQETRGYLADGAMDAIDDVVSTGKKLRKSARQAVKGAAERVMDATTVGERAYSNAKNA